MSRLGWSVIVQPDKGPLPNSGGSTGHASKPIKELPGVGRRIAEWMNPNLIFDFLPHAVRYERLEARRRARLPVPRRPYLHEGASVA